MTTIMIIGDVGGCAPELARAVESVVDDPGTEWAPLILRDAELIA
jgi:hypothetical protein